MQVALLFESVGRKSDISHADCPELRNEYETEFGEQWSPVHNTAKPTGDDNNETSTTANSSPTKVFTFDNVDRNYDVASKNFSLDIPKVFNFAFDVLDVRAQEADKEALLSIDTASGNVSSVTYSELSKVSAQFGKALLSLGLKKGDAACVLIGRNPNWHKVLFGCMKVGVISMPGTNLLTAKDIAYRINESQAKAVIVSPMHVEKVNKIVDQCPSLKYLIVELRFDTLKILIYSMAPLAALYISLLSLGKFLSLIITPSILKEAALLIKDPIFLGSVTPSRQIKVTLFFPFIYSLRIGF